MTTNEITASLAPELDRALAVIGTIAQRQAEGRATSIAQLSNGAVTTSPEQVEAIAAGIRADLIGELRDQVRSTVSSYTASTEMFKG